MDGQRDALEATIAAGAGILTDKHAALLALCRQLADQMDGAAYDDDGGPSTRLAAAYLSALKDLGRALAVKPVVRTGGNLAQLRGIDGGQPAPAARPVRRRRSGA